MFENGATQKAICVGKFAKIYLRIFIKNEYSTKNVVFSLLSSPNLFWNISPCISVII